MKRIVISIVLITLLFSVQAFAAIAPPTNLAEVSKTNTTVNLSWTINSANYDSIMVYLSDGTWIAQRDSASTAFQDTGLTPGETRSYYVLADSAGTTASSDTISVQLEWPENHGKRYTGVLEAEIKAVTAASWATTVIDSFAIASTATDSSAVIIPFNYTSFMCDATGSAPDVKIYFYNGRFPGPPQVVLVDSLIVDSAGTFRKALKVGPPIAYAVMVGQSGNGSNTVIKNAWWTMRREGSIK